MTRQRPRQMTAEEEAKLLGISVRQVYRRRAQQRQGKPGDVSQDTAQTSAGNDSDVIESRVEAALNDTIRRQDEVIQRQSRSIDRLEQLLAMNSQRLEDVLKALPVPTQSAMIEVLTEDEPTQQTQDPAPEKPTQVVPRGTRAVSIFWRVFAVLTIAAALAVLMLWIFFPPKQKAQPINHAPVIRKLPHTSAGSKTSDCFNYPEKTPGKNYRVNC